MRKTVFILMILTMVSKIFGFFREITLSYFYGASNISDAYLISLTIPTVIFSFIAAGIRTTYIPVYSEIDKEKGVKLANEFTNNIINLLVLLSTIIIIIILLFTAPIVKLFASGFEGETLTQAVNLTRISIFSIYFIGLVYISEGYLQLKKNFIIPGLIGFPLNFVIIASIIFSYNFDTKILAIGRVVAVTAQILFLIPFMYKKGYNYNFTFDIKDSNLKKMIHLSLPVILGTSVDQINKLVDRTIASQVAIGGISALNYAHRINSFVQSIFVMSLATVLYPLISRMAAEHDIKGLKKSVSQAIIGISLLVIPATVGTMIFAEAIVKILFGRGAFDSQAISMTSYALFFYSIGMIGFGIREVISRVFYSLQNTKTPMINAATAMVMNIILNIVLSRYLGIGGLALATSISATVCTLLLFISLRKRIGQFGIKHISISFLKIVCAALIMGVIANLSFNYLTTIINHNTSLIISIAIGAATYFTIIYFMKIEDVDVVIKAIKRKLKKNVK